MINIVFRLFVFILIAQSTFACTSEVDSAQFEKILSKLANTKGMEFVYGDKFPIVNPYGSYGSSFVLDFVESESVESSIFFLARKKNKFYKGEKIEKTVDLIRNYDYFYIYAVKEKNTESFQVKDVISEGAGLMGMSLFHGWIDIKSKRFVYTESGLGVDSTLIDRRKLSTAIVISSESSTKTLFNYDGKWIQSSEIEL